MSKTKGVYLLLSIILTTILVGFFVAVKSYGRIDVKPTQVVLQINKKTGSFSDQWLGEGHQSYNRWTTDLVSYRTSTRTFPAETLSDDERKKYFFECETRNGEKMIMDVEVFYQLDPNFVLSLHKNIGPSYEEKVLLPLLQTASKNAAKAFFRDHDEFNYVEYRQGMEFLIREKLTINLEKYPAIKIRDVFIRRFNLIPKPKKVAEPSKQLPPGANIRTYDDLKCMTPNQTKDEEVGRDCPPLARAILRSYSPGENPMFSKNRKKRYDQIELLLKQGADVNQACTDTGDTPLHIVSKYGDINLIYLLKDHGADLNVRNNLGYTPLFKASSGDVVTLLLAFGADIDAVNSVGETPLISALYLRKPGIVKALLQNGADPLKAIVPDGASPMDMAKTLLFIKKNQTRLKRCFNLMKDYENLRKNPPLQPPMWPLPEKTDPLLVIAVKSGDLEQVRAVLEKISYVNGVGVEADRPLHLAIKANRADIVELLLKKGADVSALNGEGQSPIDLASHSPIITQLLIDHGAMANQSDLLSATNDMNIILLKFLLDRVVDINAQDDNGDTALHYAVRDSNEKMVEILLSVGADVTIKNFTEKTPYDIAMQLSYGSPNILEILTSHMAVEVSAQKETILRKAVEESDYGTVKRILEEGMDPANIGDIRGNNLLHLASNPDIILILVQKGLHVDAKNSNEDTPLHLRVDAADVEAVRALLRCEASTRIEDRLNRTPMQMALSCAANGKPDQGRKYLEIIQLLIEAGTDKKGLKEFCSRYPVYHFSSIWYNRWYDALMFRLANDPRVDEYRENRKIAKQALNLID